MCISRINESDLEECAELFTIVFNGKPWNDKWDKQSAFNRLRDIYRTPNFEGIKYSEGDVIKGAIFGNCEEWYEGKHFNIKELFVSNKVQGKKIGSKLLNQLELQIEKLGVNYIVLYTQNNKLKNFYLKNSFKEETSLCIMKKTNNF